ncbi:arsenate reductase/protein-tyrosine-phosphatase family protein [Williamsia soli]|uniref:arsenate reductase/protein-tyrosine-phosphatase family protein n=1 Tax=Williamsia soli TaxID=364929 RepID=UPI001A9D9D3D|nr:hypothetical protein [Williamsia soli]
MKVLFVYTGNICRSPVAERMLAANSDNMGLNLVVQSAGTRAMNGHDMHPESQRTLIESGTDASGFRSRLLTPSIVAECDLVLGMTREHRAVSRQHAPAQWKRMFALRELSEIYRRETSTENYYPTLDPMSPNLDIADPIGRRSTVFDLVAVDIETCIVQVARWINDNRSAVGVSALNQR